MSIDQVYTLFTMFDEVWIKFEMCKLPRLNSFEILRKDAP